MKTIEEILADSNIDEVIKALSNKRNKVPEWKDLIKLYEPSQHEIMINKTKYPDKPIKNENGDTIRQEPITRIAIGLQKLATRRMSEFLFTIPVNSTVNTISKEEKDQFDSLMKVLKRNKWDSLNKKRCKANLSECEQATYWYAVPGTEEHAQYGFPTKMKIKYTLFSPSRGDELFPLFDDVGDMIAFSRKFEVAESSDKKTVYFETWTSTKHLCWAQEGGSAWKDVLNISTAIGKIPIIYSYRQEPIWADGDNGKVEQIEKLLSKNGDILDYHSSPVLIIKGNLVGGPIKGEANKVFQVQDGEAGDAKYVSWEQSPESTKFQFESLLRMFWTEMQLPDLSYENVKGIGATSGVALKLLFSDAHLKCGDESETFIDIIEREYNVIKAYLGSINVKWAKSIGNLDIEPEIRPYIVDDEKEKIDVLVSANGGKPLISWEQSVQAAGLVEDPQADFVVIKAEWEEDNLAEKNLFNTAE